MQVGDVLVVRNDAPGRFLNIKPGALFKVVRVRDAYNGKIVVGDRYHAAINTRGKYFYTLRESDRAHIRNTGNTDLAVRLRAIETWGPPVPKDASTVTTTVNETTISLPVELARALAVKNGDRLVQKRLRKALGR